MRTLVYGVAGSFSSNSAIRYAPIQYGSISEGTGPGSTSSDINTPMPEDFIFRKFRVILTTAPGASASWTFTLVLNNVDTTATFTISGASAVSGEWKGGLSVPQGSTISVKVTPSGTPSTVNRHWYQHYMEGVGQLISGQSSTSTASDITGHLFSGGQTGTYDTRYEAVMPCAGTFSNLYGITSVAPGTGANTTFTFYKNGVATSLVANVGSVSRVVGDLVNSVSVVAGDRVSIFIDKTGSPQSVCDYTMLFTPTNDGDNFISFSGSDTTDVVTTEYNTLGMSAGWTATESTVAVKPGIMNIHSIYMRDITAPAATRTHTYTLRKNTADTSLTVQTSNANPSNNASSTVSIGEDDLIAVKNVPALSPAATYINSGFRFTIPDTVYFIVDDALHTNIPDNISLDPSTLYSYESSDALPTDDSQADVNFIASDYTAVTADDISYAESAGRGLYNIFVFKQKHSNNTDDITLTWRGMATLAPSTSTVYLQIYNQNSNTWETVDSDNSTGIDTEFDLTATISSSPSNYYDVDNDVLARVYQENP